MSTEPCGRLLIKSFLKVIFKNKQKTNPTIDNNGKKKKDPHRFLFENPLSNFLFFDESVMHGVNSKSGVIDGGCAGDDSSLDLETIFFNPFNIP